MVYKYFWPWDNPWTSCRSWVITPSILKDIEHPLCLLLTSQPGFYKGPSLWSKWAKQGKKPALSPQGLDSGWGPSPGRPWLLGTQDMQGLWFCWGAHIPWPNSRPKTCPPPKRAQWLHYYLMMEHFWHPAPICLGDTVPRTQTVLVFLNSLSILSYLRKITQIPTT